MFFGGFLVAALRRHRAALLRAGGDDVPGRRAFFANTVEHVGQRIDIWLDPFAKGVVNEEGYQIAQSLFAQADGGLFGEGFGEALLEPPGGGPILPAADTDLIYALIVNELGLFGAAAVVLVDLLIAARGFKAAMLSRTASPSCWRRA